MSATFRAEKLRGMTLTVQDGMLTIIHDKTGIQVAAVVDSDDEVKWLSQRALPFLMALTETFKEWKQSKQIDNVLERFAASVKSEAQHIIEDKQTGG